MLKRGPTAVRGTYNLEEVTKSLKMCKYLPDALQVHERSKFLATMMFPP